MKEFMSFVQKEIFHIFRDPITMLILLCLPLAQLLLVGFALSNEVNHVRMAVYTPSQDVRVMQLVEHFSANKYFDLTFLISDPSEIEKAFKRNEVDVVMVFEKDFENNLKHQKQAHLQFVIDGAEPNTAQTIQNYTNQVVNQYFNSLAKGTPKEPFITPQIKLLYNPQMISAFNFVPGVMGLILTLICAMMTAVSVVREKEKGTMEILLVSPMKPIFSVLAKIVPYFLLSVVNIANVLLLSHFVLGVPIHGSLWLLALLCFIFLITVLSLGLLISSIVKTQVAALMISGMALIMPTAMFSGMMFPVESMPLVLQYFSSILPARWFIQALRKVMIEGLGIGFIHQELTILIGISLFLLFVSLKKFKIRLE